MHGLRHDDAPSAVAPLRGRRSSKRRRDSTRPALPITLGAPPAKALPQPGPGGRRKRHHRDDRADLAACGTKLATFPVNLES